MRDLTTEPAWKGILLFALPMLIGNVFQQLYTTVDSVVVGQFVGKNALAAVGVSFPILFLLVALVIGITMGTTVVIAQYVGARDLERVRKAIETTYVFIFLASLLITVLGISFSESILRLLLTPEEILVEAKRYLDIMFLGMFLLLGHNTVGAVLRGVGDSKTPLYLLMVATVVNIALDLLFVLVFRWGVAGVAFATVIAQGISFALGIGYLRRSKRGAMRLRLKRISIDASILRHTLRIGLPSAVQQTLVALGIMALARIVNGFGADAIAAYTAAGRLDTFAIMPAMNFAMAISVFVGQNVAAQQPDRVREGYRATLLLSGVFSAGVSTAMVLFRHDLIGLFNADPAVVHIGSRYLLIVSSAYVVLSTMFVTNGLFRGAGDAIAPMIITLVTLWLIRIPVSTLLAGPMGTDGIWLGAPVAWGLGLAMSVGYYRTGRWRAKGVVRPGTGSPRRETARIIHE